jgi:undecaprenyl pyrophosphate phosphatase UppP
MTEQYGIIVAVVSIFSPQVFTLFNYWILQVKDDECRKSIQFLVKHFLSFSIAAIVNFVGNYNIDLWLMFLMGEGISQPVGELAYRGTKFVKSRMGNGKQDNPVEEPKVNG